MKDFLGNEWGIGSVVTWAAMSGRSVTMSLGVVTNIQEKEQRYSDKTRTVVTVQPVADSRWDQHGRERHYIDSRTGEEIKDFWLHDSEHIESGGYYQYDTEPTQDKRSYRWRKPDGELEQPGEVHWPMSRAELKHESGKWVPVVWKDYVTIRHDRPRKVHLYITQNIIRFDGEVQDDNLRHEIQEIIRECGA